MSETTTFTIRRKVFTIFGAKFHIYKEDGSLLGFSKQKAFKLKEDIRVFTDESMTKERIAIKARKVIDFGSGYDVFESGSDKRIGVLRRKGLKSIFRDEWLVLDGDEQEIGKIKEDSAMMALLRRFTIPMLFPQKYHLTDDSGEELASFRTHFNPFVHKLTVTFPTKSKIPPALIVAGGILLAAIEGRQN